MQFHCAHTISLCNLEQAATDPIGFIALCLAGSLIAGHYLARFLIP